MSRPTPTPLHVLEAVDNERSAMIALLGALQRPQNEQRRHALTCAVLAHFESAVRLTTC